MSNRKTLPDIEAENSDKATQVSALFSKTAQIRVMEQFKGCRNIDDIEEEEKK